MLALLSAVLLVQPGVSSRQSFVSLLSQAASSQASSSNPLITYHGEAQNIADALEGISSASSHAMQFHVGDSLKNEVIIVDVTNVPLNDLLQRIAKVEFAKWTIKGDTAYLNIDDKAESLQAISTYANKTAKLLAALNADEEDSKSQVQPSERRTSTDELLKLIGSSELVKIPNGERRVFSNHPNAMQLPFPTGSEKVVRKLSKIAQKANRISNSKKPGKKVDDTVAKIDLVLSKNPLEFSYGEPSTDIFAEILNIDSHGNTTSSLVLTIPTFPNRLSNSGLKSHQASALGSANNTRLSSPIDLTGLARKMYDSLEFIATDFAEPTDTMSDHGLKYFLDPVKYEPLTIMGSIISSTAKAYDLNLVASLPDSIYTQPFIRNKNIPLPSPRSEMQSLVQNQRIQIENVNGWLTIRPAIPSANTNTRLDRNFLKQTLTYFHTVDTPDLESLSHIAVKLKGELSGISEEYFFLIRPSLRNNEGDSNWKLLQFYGLLGPSNQNQLDQGGKISFTNLSANALRVARELIYGNWSMLYTFPKSSDPITRFPINASTGEPDIIYSSTEPTEVAPNGISNNYPIMSQITNSTAYRVSIAPSTYSHLAQIKLAKLINNSTEVAGKVGMNIAAKEAHQQELGSEYLPKITQLTQGKITFITLMLFISPNLFAGGTLNEDSFPKNSKTYTSDNFPADVRAAIKKAEKEINSEFSGSATNAGGPP